MWTWLLAAALAAPIHRPAVDEDGVEVPPAGEVLRILTRGGAASAALSPDGSLLAIGEPEGRVRLWSITRRADHNVLEGLRRAVGSVHWAGGVVVGTDRGGIAAWSPDDPSPLWVRPVDTPRVAVDGGRILVRSAGRTISLDPRSGQVIGEVEDGAAWAPIPDLLDDGTLERDPTHPDVLTWSATHAPSALPVTIPMAGWESLGVAGDVLAGTSRQGLVVTRDLGTGARIEARDHSASGPLAASVDVLAAHRRGVLRLDPHDLEVLERLDADARVTSVAASSDGSAWAAGTSKGRILVGGDGHPRSLVRHQEAVRSLAFSPDGGTLASGAEGGTALLWDLRPEIAEVVARQGLGSPVTALALSDSLWLAGTREGSLHVMSTSGRALHELEGHGGAVTEVVLTPGGEVAVTTSSDERVRVWSPRAGQLDHVLEGHDSPVRALVMHPSGSAVLAGDKRGAVLRWSLPDGPAVRLDRDQAMALQAVAWAPDGAHLVTGGDDGGVRLWRADTGSQVAVLGTHDRPVVSVAVSPDGALVASGAHDHTARLWRVTGGLERALRGATVPVHAVTFSPDGTTLAASAADGAVRAWTVADGEPAWTLGGFERDVSAVEFTEDGRFLLAASWDKTARIFDLETGVDTLLMGPWGAIRDATLHPDGRRLATASKDGLVRVWHPDGRRHSFVGHGRAVNAVAFDPDGGWVASGGADGAVRLVELSSARPGPVLTGHLDAVRDVAWSPDGSQLASVGSDGVLSLWSAPQGQLVWQAVALADGSWASHSTDGRLRGSAAAVGGAGGPVEVAASGVVITPDDGRSPGRLEVTVRAVGPGPALDVQLGPTWVPGLLVEPGDSLASLAPGDSAVLTARLVASGASLTQSLPVEVLAAGRDALHLSVEVPVHRPVLELVRARHAPDHQALLNLTNTGDVTTGLLDLELRWVDHRGEVRSSVRQEWPALPPGPAVLQVEVPAQASTASRVRLTARSRDWPDHAWVLEVPLRGRVPWALFGGALAASAALMFLGRTRGASG